MRPYAPHARGRILGKPVSVHSMFSHLQPGDGLGERPAHIARSRDDAVLDRVAANQQDIRLFVLRPPADIVRERHGAWRVSTTRIAIFAQRTGRLGDGHKVRHYYVQESVGIATGFLIAALHSAGTGVTYSP